MSRLQGYLSRERNPVLLDGSASMEEPAGLPTQDSFIAHVPSARPVRVALRSETIVAQPSSDLSKELPIVDFLW